MRIKNFINWAIVIALVALSLANAQWIASAPEGSVRLIAAKPGSGDCPSVNAVRKAVHAGGDLTVLSDSDTASCATREQALAQLGRHAFIFAGGDPQAALALFAKRDRPFDPRGAYIGEARAVAAFREAVPGAWAFTIAEGRRCYSDYAIWGWLTLVPESCRGGTMLVPLDGKWKLAGWPKRLQSRLEAASTRIILTGPGAPADAIPGLTTPEQIPEIPRDYAGYVWLDDIGSIGPSIRP